MYNEVGDYLDCLMPDKVWSYKNFNMGAELDIAGEFIYDGINALNQIGNIEEYTGLFSFLYHTAVGIERLQKIIVVLYETVNIENHKDFEKELITHSHTKLNEWICKHNNPKLNARENAFLQLLTSFYNSARYDRFNLNSQFAKEKEDFKKFLTCQFADKIEYHPLDPSIILVTPCVKEMLGRVIGSLSKKYYNLVRSGCKEANTFTYELRTDSKAEKVFLSTYSKHSLQMQKVTENLAFKELLVYLRNTKEKHGLIHYIDSIAPLEFDPALINDYINEIAKGTIPQSLVDEIETLYAECDYGKEREEQIEIIGSSNVDFNYYPVHLCYQLMDEFVSGKKDYLCFMNDFSELYKMIDDEEYDILSDIPGLCDKIKKEQISHNEFKNRIKQIFNEFKKTTYYEH